MAYKLRSAIGDERSRGPRPEPPHPRRLGALALLRATEPGPSRTGCRKRARSGLASVYGVAGSLVLLLLWVYYSSMIVLLGAGFTRIHSRRYRAPGVVPEPGAMRRGHAGRDST